MRLPIGTRSAGSIGPLCSMVR
ncbi:hypothetical protein RHECNPAF_2530073 [Rhizobium etli CNPAF512]|nr:hypothetical protein RHECNPAF_2530073 [Rhizobium etli CNPAF512]